MINDRVQIGKISISNRLAVPPMVCFCWSDDSGMVTAKNIEHYRALAEGGFGLIIVEATAVTKRGRLHSTELGLWDDLQIEGMSKIAAAIHEYGAKAFVQLVHAGGNGIDPQADAPGTMRYREGIEGIEMTHERIRETVADFARAAVRAEKAGFDGIELHGCHGYLVSAFFNKRNNTRTDEYGTDKSLFAREVLTAIREACSPDMVVGIRIGAFEPVLEDGLEHARAIAEYVDFMDVSYGGDCEGCRPEGFPCSEAVYGAMRVKQELPDMPVFGVHNINSREDVDNALATGIDMVDIGKASLVDPAFAKHLLNNEPYGQCRHCKNYCRWNPWEMSDPDKICPGYALYSKKA